MAYQVASHLHRSCKTGILLSVEFYGMAQLEELQESQRFCGRLAELSIGNCGRCFEFENIRSLFCYFIKRKKQNPE